MTTRNRSLCRCALAVGVAVIGCGGEEPTGPVTQVAEKPADAPAETPANTQLKPPARRETTKAPPKRVGYRPPFPDRQDLFSPKQKKRVARRGDRESGEDVVLKGFANVDGQKVVLAIDGRITPLAAGAEVYGVKVISINPPEAVLQRGRSRWTATLQ